MVANLGHFIQKNALRREKTHYNVLFLHDMKKYLKRYTCFCLLSALLLTSCGAGNEERRAHEECRAACVESAAQLARADSCFRAGNFDTALLYAEQSLESLAVCDNVDYDSILYATRAHERLSVIYAALGQKANSDHHRNGYLDGLNELRQDVRTQIRIEELHEEADTLNLVIYIIICVALLLIAVFVLLWRKRNASIQREIEGETYLYRKHIEDKKRDTVVKLASLSIVNGITPYLERAVNAVDKLRHGLDDGKETNIGRLNYIRELIDKINEYNDVVTRWVMMRHGTVKLNVENFPLSAMFDTLLKNKASFDSKNITLTIRPSESVVKADMALTFFMINTLLDNARKYTAEGGTVTLSAAEGEGFVEISVEDTGCGLSAADISRILNDKVYDSAKIGDADRNPELKRNKGFGFGLMSCKGIIDKYKKTSHLFDVCRFSIKSTLGEGSVFSFRLPKGVMKAMTALLLAISSFSTSVAMTATDSILTEASSYADSTYYSNLRGDYGKSLEFADSAIAVLGVHYDSVSPDMSLLPVILDLRNEVSIAAMALREWELYEHNNRHYATLYHQTSADASLEEECKTLEDDNAHKRNVILVSVILLLVAVIIGALQLRLSTKKPVRDFVYKLRARLNPHTKMVVQEEEKRRAMYEENTIHVHNQVLDNCLSTIKHETMYYPSRIRQLVDRILLSADNGISRDDVEKMYELVVYYREIFSLLYRYASRQLDNVVFKRHAVDSAQLADYARTLFDRQSRKQGSHLTLSVERPAGMSLMGDEHLLQYLLYNFIVMSFGDTHPGSISIEFSQSDEFLTITFADNRGAYTSEQLDQCFYPDFLAGKDDKSASRGVHFLLCKQIVREHDERAVRRGSRIFAEPLGEEGYRMVVKLGVK